jgi:hypothetical protein
MSFVARGGPSKDEKRARREPRSLTLLLMKTAHLLVCLVPLIATADRAAAQAAASAGFANSTQMIVVTTPGWDAVQGRLERLERADAHEAWHRIGEPIPVVVGGKGLGWGIGLIDTGGPKIREGSEPVKREGDGKSPAGAFALGTAFGDSGEALAGSKLPYLALTPSVECVDDPASKSYNRIVDRSKMTPDWNSSEHMRAIGQAYLWGIVIDHNATVPGNASPRPGGGSCVFLHIWSGPASGTAGCTAMAQENLESLLLWLDPRRKPVLVQLPEAAYRRLTKAWRLPEQAEASAHSH